MSEQIARAYIETIIRAHGNKFSYIGLDPMKDGSYVVYFDTSVRSDTVQAWFRRSGLQTDYCGMTRVGLDMCYELHFWRPEERK